jgi:hypothetical protein
MVMYRYIRLIVRLTLVMVWVPGVAGAAAYPTHSVVFITSASPDHGHKALYLAQADERPEQNSQPKSGTLVLPPDYDNRKNAREQTCIRVCSNWGETCVYDMNKGRKCRRTCKETTMECFER